MKEKRQRHRLFGFFGTFPKMLKKESMEEISLRDALTSSNWSVKRSMSVNIYNDAEGFLLKKKNKWPLFFWAELFIKKKRRGRERENASVWMDSKQAPKLISFLFFVLYFLGLMRVAAILAFGNNIRRLETYRIEARTSHSRV